MNIANPMEYEQFIKAMEDNGLQTYLITCRTEPEDYSEEVVILSNHEPEEDEVKEFLKRDIKKPFEPEIEEVSFEEANNFYCWPIHCPVLGWTNIVMNMENGKKEVITWVNLKQK